MKLPDMTKGQGPLATINLIGVQLVTLHYCITVMMYGIPINWIFARLANCFDSLKAAYCFGLLEAVSDFVREETYLGPPPREMDLS